MRRTPLMKAISIGITLACVCLAMPAQAAGLVLSVDPADSPLQIQGILDGQTTAFSGNVRLTVTGGDAPRIQFLASDLHHTTEPATIIERSNIAVASNLALSNGQPTDVRVTVSGVKRAGDYTGALQFLLPGQPITQALSLPLKLHIGVKPVIVPILTDQTFQVTRCDWWFDCFLANLLLGSHSTREVWYVQLDNQASLPAAVTSAQAVLHGNHAVQAVTASQVFVDSLPTLPANGVSTVPVTITRQMLQPDSYQGKLRFSIQGLDQPVTINSTLNVRNGPWWALVAVFLGIVAGRMARDMESVIAQKQVKLLPRWYTLKARIEQITDDASRRQLDADLQAARTAINSQIDTEEVATKSLDDLEAKITFLLDLQTVAEKLPSIPDVNVQKQAQALLDAARAYLLGKQWAEAEQARKQLTDLLQNAATVSGAARGLRDDVSQLLSNLANWLARPTELSPKQSHGAFEAANRRQASYLRRVLASLSGFQVVTADTRFWFFRPVLSVLFLILLMLLGLQTLYVNTGATFGAGGLYDYLGLFFWGITADVAQRTLLKQPQT
ncbi:MAG: hypothetical protein U0350_44250 [Caldilineaceae bacterium]